MPGAFNDDSTRRRAAGDSTDASSTKANSGDWQPSDYLEGFDLQGKPGGASSPNLRNILSQGANQSKKNEAAKIGRETTNQRPPQHLAPEQKESQSEHVIKQSIGRSDSYKFLRQKDSGAPPRDSWISPQKVFSAVFVSLLLSALSVFGIRHYTEEINGCLRQGCNMLQLNRPEEAIMLFSDALSKNSHCAPAYFYRGMAYAQSGEYEQADDDFRKALAVGGPSPAVMLAQASLETYRENWQQALALCNQAEAIGGAGADLYRVRANCFAHLKDFQRMIQDYDKALSLSKDAPDLVAEIIADRGYAKVRMNQMAGGIADLTSALKIQDKETTRMLRGDAYRKMKDYPKAIADYNRVIAADPGNYNALVARGICKSASGKDKEALPDFGKAIKLNPDGVEALIQRGSLYLKQNNCQLAIDDLEHAQSLNPKIKEIGNKLSTAYNHQRHMGVTKQRQNRH